MSLVSICKSYRKHDGTQFDFESGEVKERGRGGGGELGIVRVLDGSLIYHLCSFVSHN